MSQVDHTTADEFEQREIGMFTDEQVLAALRAWWNLYDGDPLPWVYGPEGERFQETSMRDMRAALEAAYNLTK